MTIGFLTWLVIVAVTVVYLIIAGLFWELNNRHLKRLGRSLAFRIFFSFAWPVVPPLGNIARRKFLQACPDGKQTVNCEGNLERQNNDVYVCNVCGKKVGEEWAGKISATGHLKSSVGWLKFSQTFWRTFL